MIEFFLNGEHQTLTNADPNLSILEWLRTKMRLTGTKEGCASGDCGACTVSIGSPDPTRPERLRYDSINSCIGLVGSLHGCHLVTVDALKQEPVHPVQKAMIDCHGAQCGFCTPGIIMSLFTLHTARHSDALLAQQPVPDNQLLEALAGNLCRCTGYRPIIAAGRKACVETWSPAADQPRPLSGPDWLQAPDMTAALTRMATQRSGLEEEATHRRYDTPLTVDELRSLRADHPNARLIAGGTDLALEITQQLKDLEHLIAVDQVAELKTTEIRSDALYLGAGVTYRQMQALLPQYWPHFAGMLERLGSLQIRNKGTLGGNIGNASPIGDMPPALIALGAELELDSTEGVRRLPLESFFLDYKKTDIKPGEFIRGVTIPLPQANDQLLLYKISKRLDDDISTLLGAFWLRFDDADRTTLSDCRIAFGGMAAIPRRAQATEKALIGQSWDAHSIAAAVAALASDFQPMSDVRGSADYRNTVAGNLLTRALLETTRSHTDPALPLTVNDYA
ncbi:xanthine dehydrogenase small subunit [Marinobacter sp. V034]|uniref:xanthine dehydrogenase small subunit n=1 Tax=Marinobacter sp. V034 TaxID=3459610 RepID=UPI004043FBC9